MRLNIEDTLKRAVSAATLFFFLTTTSVSALPASGITIAPSGETPGFLQIEIPPDLASIEEVYEAPAKPDPRLILHIQNLHGNESAQTQIKKLLGYLYEKYGFKMLFVEGAVEELNPDYLRLFADKERNVKLAEALVKQGELTGVEYYLMDGPEDVRAIGIEKADLYRANYEAFKKVYGAKAETDQFLADFDGKLQMLASRIFPQETRRILTEWKKFEAGHRDFLPFVKRLAQDSKRVLGLDLESLFAQVEWPQITRLLVIQGMEKDMNESAAMAERTRLVEFLKTKQVPSDIIAAIEKLGDRKITVSRKDDPREKLENLPRYLFERMVEEAGPKGFYFHDYPAFSLWAGHLILQNELDSKQLFDEIHRVFEKILIELAASEPQKNLLELYQDGELLRKLYALEVSRKEWERVLYRREWIEPKSIQTRLEKIGKAMPDVALSAQPDDKLSSIFSTALDFYQFAREREDVFYETIEREMNGANAEKAVLVTGGFHTDGVMEKLRESEINYSVLMPRIGGALDNSNYVSAMLENGQTMFDLATLEAVVKQQGGAVVSQGASLGAESRRVVNQFINIVQSSVLDGLVDLGKLRSELRRLQQTSYISSRGVGVNIGEPQANQQSVRFAFQPVTGKPAAYDVTFYATNGKLATQAKISADQTPPSPPSASIPMPAPPRSETRSAADEIEKVWQLIDNSSLGANDNRDRILELLQKAIDLAKQGQPNKAAIAREIIDAEKLFSSQTNHLPSIDAARSALTALVKKWKRELPSEESPLAKKEKEKPGKTEAEITDDSFWFEYVHSGEPTTFGAHFLKMLQAARDAGFHMTRLVRGTRDVVLVIKGKEGDRSIDRFESESDNVRVEQGDVFRIKFANPRRSEARAMILPEDAAPAAGDAPTLRGFAEKVNTIAALKELGTVKEPGMRQIALLNRLDKTLSENSRDRWIAIKIAERIGNPAQFFEVIQTLTTRQDDISAMPGSGVITLLEDQGLLVRSEKRTDEEELQSLLDSLKLRHRALQTARQTDASASVEDPISKQRVSGAEGVAYLSAEIKRVEDQLVKLRSELRTDLTKENLEDALRNFLDIGYPDIQHSPAADAAKDITNPEKVTIRFTQPVAERTQEKREKMRSQLAKLGAELTSENFFAGYFFRVELPQFAASDYKAALDEAIPYQLVFEKAKDPMIIFMNDRSIQLPAGSTIGQLLSRLGLDRSGMNQKTITVTAVKDRQGKDVPKPIDYVFDTKPSTTKDNALSLFSIIQPGDKISMTDKKKRSELREVISWEDFEKTSATGEFGRVIAPGKDPSIPLAQLQQMPEGLRVSLGTKEAYLIFSVDPSGNLQVQDSEGGTHRLDAGTAIVAGRGANQAKITNFPEIQSEEQLKRINLPAKRTSGVHFFARNDGQNLMLRDLNSTNGSFVVLFPAISLEKVLAGSAGQFLAKLPSKQRIELTTDDFFSLAESDRPKLIKNPNDKPYQQLVKKLVADVLFNGVLFYLGSDKVFVALGRIGGGQLQLQEWKVLPDGTLEMGFGMPVAKNDLHFMGASPKVDPSVRAEFKKGTILTTTLSKAAGLADTHAAIFWDGEKLAFIDLSQAGTSLHRKQAELLHGIRTITDTTDKISSASISMVSQGADLVLMNSRFKSSANDAKTTGTSIPEVLEFQVGKRQMRLTSLSNPVITQKATIAFQVEARGVQEGENAQPYTNIGTLEIDVERQGQGPAVALPGGLRVELQDVGYLGLDDRIKAWYAANVAGKPFSEQNSLLRRLTIGEEARVMITTLTDIANKLAAGGTEVEALKAQADSYISRLNKALTDGGVGLEALLGSIESVFMPNLGRNDTAAKILFPSKKIGPLTLTPLQKEMKITGVQIQYAKINQKAGTPKELADVLNRLLGSSNLNVLPAGFSVTANEASKKVLIPHAGRFAEIDYRDFDALVQVIQGIADARSELRKIGGSAGDGEDDADGTANIQSGNFAIALLNLDLLTAEDDALIIQEIQGLLEDDPDMLLGVGIEMIDSSLRPASESKELTALRTQIERHSLNRNQILLEALLQTGDDQFFAEVLKELVRIVPDTGLPVNIEFVNRLRIATTEGETAPLDLDGTTLRFRSETRASLHGSIFDLLMVTAWPLLTGGKRPTLENLPALLKGMRVLNIGLETATLSEVLDSENLVTHLREKGIEAIGLDPQIAPDAESKEYVHGKIQAIPDGLKKNSFDIIAIPGLLKPEYMDENKIKEQGFDSLAAFYDKAAEEISGALKPGGWILIDVGRAANERVEMLQAFEKAGFRVHKLLSKGAFLFTKGLTVPRMSEVLDSVFVQPNTAQETISKFQSEKKSLVVPFLTAAKKGALDAQKVNSLLQRQGINLKAGQAGTLARLINQAIEPTAPRSEFRTAEESVAAVLPSAIDPAEMEVLSQVEAKYRSELRSINSRQLFERAAEFETESKAAPASIAHAQKVLQMAMTVLKTLAANRSELTQDQFDFLQISQAADRMVLASRFHSIEEMQVAQHVSVDTILESLGFSPNERNIILQHYDELDEKDALLAKILAGAETAARLFEQGKPSAEIVNELQISTLDKRVVTALVQWIQTIQAAPVVVRPSGKDTDRLSRYTEGLPERAQQATFIGVDSPDTRVPQDLWVMAVLARGFAPFETETTDESVAKTVELLRRLAVAVTQNPQDRIFEEAARQHALAAASNAAGAVVLVTGKAPSQETLEALEGLLMANPKQYFRIAVPQNAISSVDMFQLRIMEQQIIGKVGPRFEIVELKKMSGRLLTEQISPRAILNLMQREGHMAASIREDDFREDNFVQWIDHSASVYLDVEAVKDPYDTTTTIDSNLLEDVRNLGGRENTTTMETAAFTLGATIAVKASQRLLNADEIKQKTADALNFNGKRIEYRFTLNLISYVQGLMQTLKLIRTSA